MVPFLGRGDALAVRGWVAAVLVGIGVGCRLGKWTLNKTFRRMNPAISHSVAIVSRLVNVPAKIDVINKN